MKLLKKYGQTTNGKIVYEEVKRCSIWRKVIAQKDSQAPIDEVPKNLQYLIISNDDSFTGEIGIKKRVKNRRIVHVSWPFDPKKNRTFTYPVAFSFMKDLKAER